MNGIDYLDVTQEDLLGKAPTDMPMANLIRPGYNQEMNVDDTGKI